MSSGGVELAPVNNPVSNVEPFKDDPETVYKDDPETVPEEFHDDVGTEVVANLGTTRRPPLRGFLCLFLILMVVVLGIAISGSGGEKESPSPSNQNQPTFPAEPEPADAPKPAFPDDDEPPVEEPLTEPEGSGTGGIGGTPPSPEESQPPPEEPESSPAEEPESSPAEEPESSPPAEEGDGSGYEGDEPSPAEGMEAGGFASFSTVKIPYEDSEVTVELPEVSATALGYHDSYQATALHWISENYPAETLQEWPEWRKQQLFAMVAIYYGIGGDGWLSSSRVGWMTPSTPECQWCPKAQDCSAENRTKELYLHDTAVPPPPEIGLLTDLTNLEIHSGKMVPRQFPDVLPPQIARASNTMKSLAVTTADLTTGEYMIGPIPDHVWALTKLTMLDLNRNRLTGDAKFEKLTDLQYVDVSGSKLVGPIPTQIGNLGQLQHAVFDNNPFKGSLPTEMGLLTTLTHLSLNHNDLEGQIPEHLESLTNLGYLDLSNNQFTGTIPTTVGQLTLLKSFEVHLNYMLGGAIPTEIGQLTLLEDLHIGRSSTMDSTFPSELGQLTGLTALYLLHCNMKGTIPTEIGLLTRLETDLDLGNNEFTGTIPTEIGLLTALVNEIDLAFNQLEGNIPSQVGNLAENLRALRLNHNQLTGTVPTELSQMSQLAVIKLEENGLVGDFPRCDAISEQAEITFDCDEVSCGEDCPCTCN